MPTPTHAPSSTGPARVRAGRAVRHYLPAAVTAALMVAILGWLLYRQRAVLAEIELARAWPRLAAGQALILATLIIAGLVWAAIMRALGSRAAVRDHVHIYASTHLARYLPGTVWYVVGRSVLYGPEGDAARLVAVGSAIELLLSTIAGALLAVAFGLRGAGPTPVATLPVLALTVAGGALLLHPRVLARLTGWLRLPPIPPLRVRALGVWLLADGANWLLGGIVFWMIANQIGGAPPGAFAYTTFAWTLMGTLSVVVYFLPSNFGLTEVGLSLLLSRIMPSSLAVVVAVLTRVLMTIFTALACGLMVAVTTWWRRTGKPAMAADG